MRACSRCDRWVSWVSATLRAPLRVPSPPVCSSPYSCTFPCVLFVSRLIHQLLSRALALHFFPSNLRNRARASSVAVVRCRRKVQLVSAGAMVWQTRLVMLCTPACCRSRAPRDCARTPRQMHVQCHVVIVVRSPWLCEFNGPCQDCLRLLSRFELGAQGFWPRSSTRFPCTLFSLPGRPFPYFCS